MTSCRPLSTWPSPTGFATGRRQATRAAWPYSILAAWSRRKNASDPLAAAPGWTRSRGMSVTDCVRSAAIRRFRPSSIATLALGIGVNTAMFSAVDAVLIRPLPYVDADRLVMIWDEMSHIGFPKHFSTPGEWREWRRLNTVFTDIAATEPGQAALSGDGA